LEEFLFTYLRNIKTCGDLMPEIYDESRYHLFENAKLEVDINCVLGQPLLF